MLHLKAALGADVREGVKLAGEAGAFEVLDDFEVVIERSEHEERGDYACPIALSLANELQMAPIDIAQAIAEHMPKAEYIGRVTVAQPGFINIWLNPGWLTARLDNVIEDSLCGVGSSTTDRSVNLEFISANPTGPLTLGNARTAFTADTLGNVLECAGYAVTREYYVNDFGGQIRRLGESVLRRILERAGQSVEFGEELYQGEYIAEVGKDVAERWSEDEGRVFVPKDLDDAVLVEMIGAQAATMLLDEIKSVIGKDLKIEFDEWSSERALRESGAVDTVVERLRKEELLYEKEGAEYLKLGEQKSDEDPVAVKANGELTYLVPDIAYHLDKYSREFDSLLTYVGADHKTHGDRMVQVMSQLGQESERLTFMYAQWMTVLRGGEPIKMSKRAGALYSPQELIAEVGYDAARFIMVQHALSSHMDFDLDLAQERSERNPVYYVQYGYVRLQSILREAKERGVIADIGVTIDMTDSPALTHTSELALMRQMYRFPEVISEIAESHDVHALAYYAMDLAKAVHVFYRNVQVLGADNEVILHSRLQLVLAARKVLGKTLDLLGVSKPDVM